MKRVLGLSVVIALSANLFAPLKIDAQTTVGFRAGFNLATFSGTNWGEYDHRSTANVGAFLNLPLSERAGVQLGVAYSGKGSEITPLGRTEETWIRIGYLEIPALLRLQIMTRSRVSAHLLLGPTFSFKVSCEIETHDPWWWHTTTDCEDRGPGVRAFDLGATGGIGIEFELSERLSLVSYSFYSIGLRTVGDSGDGVKNRMFSLSLGLAIPIGRGTNLSNG